MLFVVSVIYSLNSSIYCDKCTVGWSDYRGMSNVENIIFIIVTRFNGSECWQRTESGIADDELSIIITSTTD